MTENSNQAPVFPDNVEYVPNKHVVAFMRARFGLHIAPRTSVGSCYAQSRQGSSCCFVLGGRRPLGAGWVTM